MRAGPNEPLQDAAGARVRVGSVSARGTGHVTSEMFEALAVARLDLHLGVQREAADRGAQTRSVTCLRTFSAGLKLGTEREGCEG